MIQLNVKKITIKKSQYNGWFEYNLHTQNGDIVSKCILNPKTGDCAEVETLEQYRNQGYMTLLLKYLTTHKGLKYVQVNKNNKLAIHLYEKIGFVIEKEYMLEKEQMYSMIYVGNGLCSSRDCYKNC